MSEAPILLAHPLTEAAELGVAPAFLGVLAAAAVLAMAVAFRRPATAVDGAGLRRHLHEQLARPLTPTTVLGRVLGGSVLLLVVAAGRLGSPEQLGNIAPALTIGAGWPALLIASAAVGGVWAWLHPFDALARPLDALAGRGGPERAGEEGAGEDGVAEDMPAGAWLDGVAVLGALGWTWWLAVWLPGLQPRAIGLGLGAYVLVTLTGCLLVGRAEWLSRAEVFTVVMGALSRSRRHPVVLDDVHAVALAVLVGGLAYAEIRFSQWFLADVGAVGLRPFSEPVAVLGYVVVVLVAVAGVRASRRWAARAGGVHAVDGVLPWLVVGLGLSAAVERDRLWSSVQLVIAQAGTGDAFGASELLIRPWPYGDVTRVVVQVVLLVLPIACGIALSVRRSGRSADAAIVLAVGWTTVAALSVATM